MGKWKEYLTVCTVGSTVYSLIEVFWRGFTHWTMALAGGAGFLLLYLTDLRLAGNALLSRWVAGCAVLTSVELLAGIVVNKLLRMQVWDYSKERGNLWGQICPLYVLLWFLLCVPAMPIAGRLRRWIAPLGHSREIPL